LRRFDSGRECVIDSTFVDDETVSLFVIVTERRVDTLTWVNASAWVNTLPWVQVLPLVNVLPESWVNALAWIQSLTDVDALTWVLTLPWVLTPTLTVIDAKNLTDVELGRLFLPLTNIDSACRSKQSTDLSASRRTEAGEVGSVSRSDAGVLCTCFVSLWTDLWCRVVKFRLRDRRTHNLRDGLVVTGTGTDSAANSSASCGTSVVHSVSSVSVSVSISVSVSSAVI
jgi:hypothetical protein